MSNGTFCAACDNKVVLIEELEAQLAEANTRAYVACQRLSSVPDHWAERYYCLADGHNHPHRWHEALCSADFQLADARAENANLHEQINTLDAKVNQAVDWHTQASVRAERAEDLLENAERENALLQSRARPCAGKDINTTPETCPNRPCADCMFWLRDENARLRAGIERAIGWRERDWPEGFCRRTAELIAEAVTATMEGE